MTAGELNWSYRKVTYALRPDGHCNGAAGVSDDGFPDAACRGIDTSATPHFFSRDFNAVELDTKSSPHRHRQAEPADRFTHRVAWPSQEQNAASGRVAADPATVIWQSKMRGVMRTKPKAYLG